MSCVICGVKRLDECIRLLAAGHETDSADTVIPCRGERKEERKEGLKEAKKGGLKKWKEE